MVIIPSERNFAEKLNLLVAWRMLFTCPMILKFGEALGLELMPQLVYIDLISAQLCLHHMSFPSVLFFSARPGGDCRWLPEHSFGQKWLRLLLFVSSVHRSGCRCGCIASFSCSACLKENFAFVSLKMMSILFVPVDMNVWASNSFSTQKMFLVLYDWLKWNSIYVLNGLVLMRINQETPCVSVSLFVVGVVWWCGKMTCRLESVRIFSSNSWMMSILSRFVHLE